MGEFKDGLKAFYDPRRNEEQQENWNNFWDNLKKNKDDISPVIDLANVRK